MLPCGVCNPILYIMGQNDPFPHQQLFSLEQYHCGETVTIIAVTIIQDGGRRRRWVRAGPDCDAYTQQCALFSAHNTRASTVLVLRVMLCKSVHLFLKYGLMKLSWYDCNFRLSCRPSFLPLISNPKAYIASNSFRNISDNIVNNVCYKMGIICTFNFHVPIDGDCGQGKWVVPLVIPPYIALLAHPRWSQWSLRN